MLKIREGNRLLTEMFSAVVVNLDEIACSFEISKYVYMIVVVHKASLSWDDFAKLTF